MKFISTAALAVQASFAAAQVATYSPSADNSISYSVNIPSVSAQSGSGDIFIQIKGPVSGSNARTWIAVGQGSGMPGAQVFIVYPNKAGNNVTLSPRLATGYFEPSYNSNAKVSLLDGTGITNGTLTANIKCSSCNSWSGGQMSYTDSASNWIWASDSGGTPINSDDTSQDIQQHNERGEFTFDLTKAAGGSSANPFVSSASTSGSSGTSGTSGTSGGTTTSSTPSTSGAASAGGGPSGAYAMLPSIVKAHASVMSLAFLFFYPLGAIIMRIGIGRPTIWVHAALQGFAYMLAIAGMGLGIWMALTLNYLRTPHAIIGLVVVSVAVLQAPLGLLHHRMFKKQGGRTVSSYIHIWLGRALITLGAINGGLGLQLAGNGNRSGTIAYGVLAGIIYVSYFALIAATIGKGKRRAQNVGARGEKASNAS